MDPAFGVRFTFGVDGIALVMIALIVVLVPVVMLGVLEHVRQRDRRRGGRTGARPRSVPNFFALLLLLEFFMIGVFAATDVFLFYVFFEVMLVPMYFLIGCFGGPRRQYAAVKFFLYSLRRRPAHAGRGDRPVRHDRRARFAIQPT